MNLSYTYTIYIFVLHWEYLSFHFIFVDYKLKLSLLTSRLQNEIPGFAQLEFIMYPIALCMPTDIHAYKHVL
jgi:hypothetical protein